MKSGGGIGFRTIIRGVALPAIVAAVVAIAPPAAAGSARFRVDPSVDARIDAIVKKMSLDQKLGQLTQQWGGEIQDTNPVAAENKKDQFYQLIREDKVGSFLGAFGADYINTLQRIAVEESGARIPLIIGNDVIHGYRTIFPIPLGEAATWDPKAVEKSARVAATEAAAAGTDWTFAPMVDIARDPRWGRIAEGSGEDPYLGSVMAAARVRGFQGQDLKAPDTILACAKHYVAYGGAEGGRDYNTVDISEYTLREVYLPPFKAAVDAGAGTLMSAFNEISGIPASGNRFTLRAILRDEWGFDGFVVSDWGSVAELAVHGYAADAADAAVKGILAGIDMDMSSFVFRDHLAKAVKDGRVPEAAVDGAVRLVLRAKFALGLFDDPYKDPAREKKLILCDDHRAAAREVARKSFVLLKNEENALPLSKGIESVAVIGPLAASQADPLGTWAARGRAEDVVTVLAGIEAAVSPNTVVTHVRGCDVNGNDESGFAAAVKAAENSTCVIMVVGESEDMSGEGHCRSDLDLPGVQRGLLKAVRGTGKPMIVVLMNGRPLSIPWMAENANAILVVWHPGVECGHAVADVLLGDHNPGGKLPATFPRCVGQVPLYYAHKNTGRPPVDDQRYTSKYIDVPWTPLYPFGYGLSYTSFEFSDLKVSPTTIRPDGSVEVSVEVKNTGKREGDEVVQLYIRDVLASVTRPVKELKGFERVTLVPGQSRRVTFTLTPGHLSFYNQDMKRVVEPGQFKVWVGPNSADGLTGEFNVVAP